LSQDLEGSLLITHSGTTLKWIPVDVEMKHGPLHCRVIFHLSAWVRVVPDEEGTGNGH